MALSLLHQNVSHTGATFAPDLTVNGWFTLHWYDDADLQINSPTALLGLANGQEFIIDVVKHRSGIVQPGVDSGKRINWDVDVYRGWVTDELYVNAYQAFGLWTGQTTDLYLARRMQFMWLNGAACLSSINIITPY